jgi:hypothetical protein
MTTQLSLAAVDRAVERQHPPLTLNDFAHGTVQAYDQALANTGMAIVKSNSTGIHVLATAMIRPPRDIQTLKGYRGNLAKADSLYSGLCRARTGYAATVDVVVGEHPPVKGQRVDSIQMAGRELHRATNGQAVFIDNRHAKAVIVGRAGSKQDPVTKAHVKEAVERLVPTPTDRGSGFPWNEHIRDAVMLALAWLYDEKRRQLQEAAEQLQDAA